jgi:hypothetical protein
LYVIARTTPNRGLLAEIEVLFPSGLAADSVSFVICLAGRVCDPRVATELASRTLLDL